MSRYDIEHARFMARREAERRRRIDPPVVIEHGGRVYEFENRAAAEKAGFRLPEEK